MKKNVTQYAKPQVLVTDTLFIHEKHVQALEVAGYAVVRLTKECATEAELCQAIKGKVGYILGGTERVTAPVIAAADRLRAIVFTGIDYHPFIPAAEEAARHDIAIGNTPEGPAHAVAEWAVGAATMMNRRMLELGRTGTAKNQLSRGIEGQKIGIIGYGHVGHELTRMLQPFRPASIRYYSRREVAAENTPIVAQPAELATVLHESDIVFLCISETGNQNWLDSQKLQAMKRDALLVDITHRGVVDVDGLYQALSSKHIRAISDQAFDERFQDLPLSHWFSMNSSSAFVTESGIDLVSMMAVEKLIELLD